VATRTAVSRLDAGGEKERPRNAADAVPAHLEVAAERLDRRSNDLSGDAQRFGTTEIGTQIGTF